MKQIRCRCSTLPFQDSKPTRTRGPDSQIFEIAIPLPRFLRSGGVGVCDGPQFSNLLHINILFFGNRIFVRLLGFRALREKTSFEPCTSENNCIGKMSSNVDKNIQHFPTFSYSRSNNFCIGVEKKVLSAFSICIFRCDGVYSSLFSLYINQLLIIFIELP